jgi:hypothetical protein
MLYTLIAFTAVFGTSAMAWKWGGLDEKLAASGFIIATIASNFANRSNYTNTETGILIIDLLLLAGLVVLALRSDRFWPMWAAAFQLVGHGAYRQHDRNRRFRLGLCGRADLLVLPGADRADGRHLARRPLPPAIRPVARAEWPGFTAGPFGVSALCRIAAGRRTPYPGLA